MTGLSNDMEANFTFSLHMLVENCHSFSTIPISTGSKGLDNKTALGKGEAE